jgi:hypothetical protein
VDALKSEIESWARSRRQKTFDTLKSSIDQRFPKGQMAAPKLRVFNAWIEALFAAHPQLHP